MRRPALPFALVLSLVLASTAVTPARAADPLWRDSPGASAPPDIVRLNDFMHDLSERMKPSLVQVRVRRGVRVRDGLRPLDLEAAVFVLRMG